MVDRLYKTTLELCLSGQPSEVAGASRDLQGVYKEHLRTWRLNRQAGTNVTTMMFTALSNCSTLVQLRECFLAGKHKKKWAKRTAKGLPPMVYAVLASPQRPEGPAWPSALRSFIELQLRGIFVPVGGADFGSHIVYQISTSCTYIGRCSSLRRTRPNVGGLSIRWSEHDRDYWAQTRGGGSPYPPAHTVPCPLGGWARCFWSFSFGGNYF